MVRRCGFFGVRLSSSTSIADYYGWLSCFGLRWDLWLIVLRRAAEHTEVMSFELFFDLLYGVSWLFFSVYSGGC